MNRKNNGVSCEKKKMLKYLQNKYTYQKIYFHEDSRVASETCQISNIKILSI